MLISAQTPERETHSKHNALSNLIAGYDVLLAGCIQHRLYGQAGAWRVERFFAVGGECG